MEEGTVVGFIIFHRRIVRVLKMMGGGEVRSEVRPHF